MPICCHGRFLRFPSSLPPPFLLPSSSVLLPFSRFTRARVTPEAQWINWTKGTTREREKRRGREERERERRMVTAYGAGALRTTWPTDLRKNVIVRIVQDVSFSLSLFYSFSFFTLFHDFFFFHDSLFYLPSPLLYSRVGRSSSRIRSEKCDKHEEDKNELSSILHGSTVKH